MQAARAISRGTWDAIPVREGLLIGDRLSTLPTSASTQTAGAASISSALTAGLSSITASLPAASASAVASSAAATATASDYAPVSIRDVQTLANNCPSIDGTMIKNHFNQNFKYTCGVDLSNLPAAEGGNITDIAAIIAYTVEDCIDACSGINFQTLIGASADGTTCSSISWTANAAASVSVGNGNCWLKKGTLASGQSGREAEGSITARLV